jgi:hypothetical protein
MKLVISLSQLRDYESKLKEMHKSAYPVVVRQTLNELAFDMKKNTITESFDRTFTVRRGNNFIKSLTAANRCSNTFDISKMESESGVVGGKSIAGNRLELQERGGSISDRYIPTDSTRVGQSRDNRQLATYYFKKFRNKPIGHNPSQKGIKTKNRPKTTYIKTEENGGRLFAIHAGGKWETMYKHEGTVRLKRKPFIEPAGLISANKLNQFFIKFATKKLTR